MTVEMNYLISMILGLGLVLAIIAWIWWLKKKNPEMTLGEVFSKILLREKFTTVILSVILINVAEAIMAASISPKGEIPVSPVARMLTHFTIAFAGIFFGIWLPSTIRGLLIGGTKDIKNFGKLFLVVVVVGLSALFFPYLNALLISGGLKETHLFARILHGNFTGGFIHMSYVMQATVCALLAHYCLVLADGIMILASSKKELESAANYGMAGSNVRIDDINKKINERGEEEKAKYTAEVTKEKAIPFLLNRYRFTDKAELQGKIKQATKIIDGMDNKSQLALSQRAHALKKKIEDWDNTKGEDLADDARQAKNKEFRESISDLFKGSTKGGVGFGMTLPTKKHS